MQSNWAQVLTVGKAGWEATAQRREQARDSRKAFGTAVHRELRLEQLKKVGPATEDGLSGDPTPTR